MNAAYTFLICVYTCIPLLQVCYLYRMYTFDTFQSWDEFFSRATQGAPPGHAYDAPPTLRPGGVTEDPNLIRDHLAVQALIRAYQIRGK